MKTHTIAGGIAAALGVVALGAAMAQATPPTTRQTARLALAGTASPAVAHAQRTGALATDTKLSVAVSLKLRYASQLQAFLAAVSNPHSHEYGHYLTAGQFEDEYSPTQATVDAVSAFLRSQGLTVTAVSGNRQVIDATGTASQAATAFGTTLSTYTDPTDREHFYANDESVTLPTSIAGVVQGVAGLNDHTVRHTNYTARPVAGPKNREDASSGYGPSDYDGAYNINKLGKDGSGETVALFEFDGYKASDLKSYDQTYQISGPAATTVSVDGANYDSKPGDGEGEVELDSEIVAGVAPQAQQLIYEAPNTDQGQIDMINKVVSDGKASVLSISWGSCEQDSASATMTSSDNAFQQAAAQGISVFSASGDDGSRDCTASASGSGVKAVDYPASDPYVTGVGGTSLKTTGGQYGSESAWSGAGGGTSTVFNAPAYQGGSGMRTVPDVASVADPGTGFAIYTGGGWQEIGGTSAAAPLWSGLTALYNQDASASGAANLGQANPALYQVATSSSYTSAFHDVTTGGNQDFPAGPGYDQVTGWGSPIADSLANTLLSLPTTTSGN